jgi:hypothetical protein
MKTISRKRPMQTPIIFERTEDKFVLMPIPLHLRRTVPHENSAKRLYIFDFYANLYPGLDFIFSPTQTREPTDVPRCGALSLLRSRYSTQGFVIICAYTEI